MPDIVRWGEAPDSRATFPCHPPGIAAVKDGNEPGLIGELAIEVKELVVRDRVLDTPVEVVGDEALILAVNALRLIVGWDLGAMTAIEEHPLVSSLSVL